MSNETTTPISNPAIIQIEAQVAELSKEYKDLTARGQDYAQVIENINVRRHEIRGAVEVLDALLGSLKGPQGVSDALKSGYTTEDICTFGPDGMTAYKPNTSASHCDGGCGGECSGSCGGDCTGGCSGDCCQDNHESGDINAGDAN